MQKEVWKAVMGWEGLYEVSNMGRVRSLDRFYAHCNRTYKGHLLTSQVAKRGGYIVVTLEVGERRRCAKVHRLVAEAFIPNPNHLPEVNHKNLNKADNTINNLEWCTALQNTQHFNSSGLRKSYSGANRKRIDVYDKAGNFVGQYEGVRVAGRLLNVANQNINDVLKGKQKSAKGYVFEYALV